MTVFVAGAMALTLVALLSIVWPLLRRRRVDSAGTDSDVEVREAENVALYREHARELDADLDSGRIGPDQHEKLVLELQRNLLDDQNNLNRSQHTGSGRTWLALAAVALVVVSAWFYQERGARPDVLFSQQQAQVMRDNIAQLRRGERPDAAPTQALMDTIEQRLEQTPDNAQYWYLLGRYASQLGLNQKAVKGFRGAYERAPQDPTFAAQLAQSLFYVNGNQIDAEVASLLDRALAGNPKNATALGLAGIAAFEEGDFAVAVDYWQRTLEQTPEGDPGRRSLRAGIARAQQQLQAGSATRDQPGASAWSLPITIELAPTLTKPDSGVLFVLAREYRGSPMPLAVARVPLGEFPAEIILDETMAMTSKDRLTQEGQVEVVARISRSGDARPQAGDLQGSVGPLDMTDLPASIAVTIDDEL